MSDFPRELNAKKFLHALPGADKSLTFWACHPEKVPAKVRRAADVYQEIAEEAQLRQRPSAEKWGEVAAIMIDAALRLEQVFTASA